MKNLWSDLREKPAHMKDVYLNESCQVILAGIRNTYLLKISTKQEIQIEFFVLKKLFLQSGDEYEWT